jgi:hypothetical protein
MTNSTQKLGIEITTDVKQAVESFRRLLTAMGEQKGALVDALQ